MNESQIFANVLKLASPAERAAYLDEACGGNPPLRADVEALLRAHVGDPGFLEHPAGSLAGTADIAHPGLHKTTEQPGMLLAGRYKLLELIGEGGMGAVWMVQQTEPVKRMVAIKLIKAGLGSKAVLTRFEAERQALALMDHPNIAKVLDAGAASDGRPFFVMELVKGVPITRYCDEHRLTPRQRLELFVPVCQAVQHAHQKGIIHRDLKPSNVLVTLYDDRPVPKVIDFGVAKATGQQLTEQTLHTGFGAVVGTVEYMSPEQAGFNQLDVDTRSDIYSLGVLLYELLTGSPPFTRLDLEKAGMLEMLQLIREKEPSKPSAKLSTADGLPTLAANRGTEPKRLTAVVRGELDWIVMKALEKDRSRRYETANAFALDLQHYLHDEPVQACPPSAVYRLKKFVRRHKGAVLAASFTVLSLVAGIVGTTWGLLDAQKAREASQEKEAETRAVLDFVERRIFAAARPEGEDGGLGHDVPLRKAVEAALPFVEASFSDQPLVEARLRTTLGMSFLYLGEAKKAQEQFEKSRAIRSKLLGPDHPETLSSRQGLAQSYHALGRPGEALKLHQEVLVLRKARLGPDHPDTLTSMHNVAREYEELGRYREALELREKTLALRKARLGPAHPDTLTSMIALGNSYSHHDRHTEAMKLREYTWELQKVKIGPESSHIDDQKQPGRQLFRSGAARRRPGSAPENLGDTEGQARRRSPRHAPEHE